MTFELKPFDYLAHISHTPLSLELQNPEQRDMLTSKPQAEPNAPAKVFFALFDAYAGQDALLEDYLR